MRKITLLFCMVLTSLAILAVSCTGNSNKYASENKIAVCITGDDGQDGKIKKVIGSKLVSTITQTSEYAAVECTAEFMKSLVEKKDHQQLGKIRDDKIVALGRQLGVKFVVVADVSDIFDEYFISSRLINMETGLVEMAFDTNGPAESMNQVNELVKAVAEGLLAESSMDNENCGLSQVGDSVQKFTVRGVTFEMVKVEGLSNDFYIGTTEVTQALWTVVMGGNPSEFRGDDRPVEKVSWNDCREFCARLSDITGRQFRLPSEIEWQFAAKGGNKSQGYTYSGSNDLFSVAWFKDNSNGSTHSVAQKRPNELGIYDMSGNVCEWTGSGNEYSRVVRGGCFFSDAGVCTVAYFVGTDSDYTFEFFGFRLALDCDKSINQINVHDKTNANGQLAGSSMSYGSNGSSRAGAPVQKFTVRGVTFEMVKVEGFSPDFYIGKTEVTQALWSVVMGSNPSEFRGDDHPVEKVSWNDCREFCARLSDITGRKFRLPSEIEWKFAAKGGNKSQGYTYSGSNDLFNVGWFLDNGNECTHSVALKQSNELGIYDMSGNVWEWTESAYDGADPVFLGGSFLSVAGNCSVTGRNWIDPSVPLRNLGFRLAL